MCFYAVYELPSGIFVIAAYKQLCVLISFKIKKKSSFSLKHKEYKEISCMKISQFKHLATTPRPRYCRFSGGQTTDGSEV